MVAFLGPWIEKPRKLSSIDGHLLRSKLMMVMNPRNLKRIGHLVKMKMNLEILVPLILFTMKLIKTYSGSLISTLVIKRHAKLLSNL